MLFIENIEFKGENYIIINREADNIMIDVIDEHKPRKLWKSYLGKVYADYYMEDRKLHLKDISLNAKMINHNEKLLTVEPEYDEVTKMDWFREVNAPLSYTGGIIIAKDIVDIKNVDVIDKEKPYSYNKVLELIFENGVLVTCVDHSKTMVKIRKNIETGLRSIDNSKDMRVMSRFIYQSYLHNYQKHIRNRDMKRKLYKLKKM